MATVSRSFRITTGNIQSALDYASSIGAEVAGDMKTFVTLYVYVDPDSIEGRNHIAAIEAKVASLQG